MRLLILGVDANGRSCVVKETEASPDAIPGMPGSTFTKLFATSESPPPGTAHGQGKGVPDRLAPGVLQWYITEHKAPSSPDAQTPGTQMHYRNALDLIIMLEGSGEMLLNDGAHPIRAGDCIVMPGTAHGLRPGPNGCRMMAFAIGTPPV
jgi:mannose-6-phosphate isomerase-like protein (cupin superfamily)